MRERQNTRSVDGLIGRKMADQTDEMLMYMLTTHTPATFATYPCMYESHTCTYGCKRDLFFPFVLIEQIGKHISVALSLLPVLWKRTNRSISGKALKKEK